MADLQNRLDAVFGGLAKPGEEQQWRPSTEQVFRVGAPIVDHAPSSDEEAEFEERTRREVVPGASSLLVSSATELHTCATLSKMVNGAASTGARVAPWEHVSIMRATCTPAGSSEGQSGEGPKPALSVCPFVGAGLAMDLAAEDEPDAEGFMPSTAFCRALDREEEYNDVDEIATGTYRGHGADALPPRNMEVRDLLASSACMLI
jgi:hypothetical protein